MSPEQFHDAMNYLDDDLIRQTDDLRQGRRVLQNRPRQVIRWLVPAACLALVLGVGSWVLPVAETNDAASMQNGEVLEDDISTPAEAIQDKSQMGSTASQYSTASWQTVSWGGISLSIPMDWEYSQIIGRDGRLLIEICPPHETGAIQIGWQPHFGVCGTGLTEKQTVIAGMQANVGYYDGGEDWTFITFRVEGETYVVLKDNVGSWWNDHADTVAEILETIVIEQ